MMQAGVCTYTMPLYAGGSGNGGDNGDDDGSEDGGDKRVVGSGDDKWCGDGGDGGGDRNVGGNDNEMNQSLHYLSLYDQFKQPFHHQPTRPFATHSI
jgi:hypothetical protein